MSYANTVVCGNLGSDPEVHTFESGATVTKFSLAVNRSWTKDGVKMEETDWYRCRAWGKRGQALAQYKVKGEPIVVDGRMQFDPGKDADGNENEDGRVWANLICREVKFVNYPKNGTTQFDDPAGIDEAEEEIPF